MREIFEEEPKQTTTSIFRPISREKCTGRRKVTKIIDIATLQLVKI